MIVAMQQKLGALFGEHPPQRRRVDKPPQIAPQRALRPGPLYDQCNSSTGRYRSIAYMGVAKYLPYSLRAVLNTV